MNTFWVDDCSLQFLIKNWIVKLRMRLNCLLDHLVEERGKI